MPAQRTESTFELSYTVSCAIRATPGRVWSLLTDAPGFPTWNSTVSQIDGDIALGNKLGIQVPLSPGRTFTPKVTGFDVEREMVWQDGMWPMFLGKRTFSLVPNADGTLEFRMTEVFTGMMLPMIKGSLPDFRATFDTYAADLKRTAEAS
jgi:hypothetical protein